MIAKFIRPLAIVAMLAAAPVAAQDTAAGDGADALPVGEEVGGLGSTYVAATHGDWEIQCERTEDGADPCVMNQLMKNAEGGSMAEINIFALPEPSGDAVAGATIITPLETLLTKNITLQVGSRQPKRYQFTFCTQIGCIARVGFTEEDIDAFRKGAEATVTVFAIAAPNQPFAAIMSLSGFTAAYEALQAMN